MRHIAFNVAGCKHRADDGIEIVRHLDEGEKPTVKLEPDPLNSHDKHAVKVYVSLDQLSNAGHIGYVPREEHGQAMSRMVSELLSNGLVDSVELESYGRLKRDPSIPRFRVRISHYPLVPGKRDSMAMTEGFSIRMGNARSEVELRKVGESIAACGRIRGDDRALLRRLYAERLADLRKVKEPTGWLLNDIMEAARR